MAKEKGKSLIDTIKDRINKAGSGRTSMFYLKADGKCRVRFLQDAEEGLNVTFHDKWGEFNHPCLEYYGKECPNCKNKEARTTDNFVWCVYNYETKRVELFCFKANRSSPIPALISMYENYGTICDRDYVIQRSGSGTDTTYAVVPLDKSKFKKDVEAYSKKEIMKMLLEAFPYDGDDVDLDDDEEDEEEDEIVSKKSKKSKAKPKKRRDEEEDDEDEDEDFGDEYEYDEEEETIKKSNKSKTKKRKVEDEEDEEDDEEDDWDEEDEEEEDEDDEPRSKKSKKSKSRR